MSGNDAGGWPGRDSSREVNVWREREIRRLWRHACEGHGFCQRIATPSGWTMAVPSIGAVALGAPTVLTIQLRPGQRLEHLQTLASEIAETMGVHGMRVIPFRGMWVRVELLAPPHRPVASPLPPGHEPPAPLPPTPKPPAPVPPVRRRGPSRAWMSRWHTRRLRKPQQPS